MRWATVPEFVASLPHGWSYDPLSLEQMNAVMAATRSLDDGDLDAARDYASSVGYEVKPLIASSECYVVLGPANVTMVGQATLIYATAWRRNLLIEAPHVPEDHRTDEEAAQLFSKLEAKAVVVAGSHRCAATVPSGCRSSAFCNPQGIAVESDAGHSVLNALNAMHLALRASDPVVVQLHTNFKPALNGDAQVSNGTLYPIAGAVADDFYSAFRTTGMDVRTCNDPLAPPPSGAFCGETSTQSLASNGAADQCVGRASSKGGGSSHRFIHLEQNNQRMDTLESWTEQIAIALSASIPATR